MVRYNFEQFYRLPGDKFDTGIKCVIWCFKHHLSQFSDLGLKLLEEIIDKINSKGNVNDTDTNYNTHSNQ